MSKPGKGGYLPARGLRVPMTLLLAAMWLAGLAGAAQAHQHDRNHGDGAKADGRAVEQTCTAPAAPPYTGPLFDAMAQTDQKLDGAEAIAAARSVGVTRMALFARVFQRQDGRNRVDGMAAAHPDFVVVGSPKRFDMRGDLDPAYVDDVLAGVAARRYAFVGEILYTHGDKAGGEVTTAGERYIDPLGPQTARLIEGLKGRQVPIMTHWEVYDWQRDRPKFDALYAAHPDQSFVWPHVGFGTADQVATLLESHPNLWGTLSKRERSDENLADAAKAGAIGAAIADPCGNLRPEWRDLLVRYAARLMFATDAHKAKRWDHYATVVEQGRRILGQLPPEVARAIAYDNAASFYGR